MAGRMNISVKVRRRPIPLIEGVILATVFKAMADREGTTCDLDSGP